MSTKDNELELSSTELRSKLFNTFKAKGILQSVKTQLRNCLALELQSKIADDDVEQRIPVESSLILQASNSIVAEHLSRCNYDFTFSVFVTESVTNPDKLYPLQDILQLLHIHPSSRLHQKLVRLSEKDGNLKGFLWSFLNHLAECYGTASQESSTQTEEIVSSSTYNSLDYKLLHVEKEQLQKFHDTNHEDNVSLQTKFLSFQRKYEAQKRAELAAEMERFQSSELVNMRLEEREKHQRELDVVKSQYEQMIQKKIKQFEEQELDLRDKTEKKKKLIESDTYEQRQKILADLQALKERELEMNKTHELALKSLELQEEKLQSKAEQLKYKEESIKNIEEKYETKLKDEIVKIKYEIQQEERQSIQSYQTREQQLKEEKILFESQKQVYLRWKDEAERLQDENKVLNQSLLNAQQNLSVLSHKCETLLRQNEKIQDYDVLKSDKLILERDLKLLKTNINEMHSEKQKREKEHQKLVKDLLGRISGVPNPENVQKEFEECKRKENKWRDKFNQLQSRYELEVLKNEEIRKLYDDSLLSQRELLREMDELRVALVLANQEKERLFKSNSLSGGRINKNIISTQPPRSFPTEKYDTRKLWLQNNIPDNYDDLKKENVNERIEKSTDIMIKLEQEALELERSYKAYQERQKAQQQQASRSPSRSPPKSPSKVHFSSYVHEKSHSDPGSLASLRYVTADINERQAGGGSSYDLSRLIPEKTTSSGLEDLQKSSSTITVSSSRQRLSSTQTTGGYDAPSFGISRVQDTYGNQRDSEFVTMGTQNPLSSLKQSDARTIQQQRSLTDTSTTVLPNTHNIYSKTNSSFTQHPLQDPTIPIDSLTQYPLMESKNTLTQYPLIDTQLQTPGVTKNQNMISTQRLDTLNEQSTNMTDSRISTLILNPNSVNVEENTMVEIRNNRMGSISKERMDSAENEHDLQEMPISTFESPMKSPTGDFIGQSKFEMNNSNVSPDVFYTPAVTRAGLQNIKSDDENITPVTKSVELSVRNSLEEKTPSIDLPSSNKSSTGSRLDMNELQQHTADILSKSLSEGELKMDVNNSIDFGTVETDEISDGKNLSVVATVSDEKATNNDNDKTIEDENADDAVAADDVMAKYMKMVMEKKEQENDNDNNDNNVEESLKNDMTASEEDNQQRKKELHNTLTSRISEKSSISEFEW